MVNVGLNWASFLGIALALGGAGLYALRTVRPALARDQDIIFAAIALLCGGVLFFQGWRLDPILQFAQTLSVASSIWFAYEAVRLRGIATEQAKRNTPVVDDERPVSRVYRAELDDYPPLDERDRSPVNRRIRGTREDIRARDDIAEDSRRTRRNPERPSLSERSSLSDRPRRPRSTRSAELSADRSERSWEDGSLGERPARSNSVRPSDDAPARSRRSRPTDASRRRGSEYASSDYVDYQPVDYSDDWS
jgi:hypothetical protein